MLYIIHLSIIFIMSITNGTHVNDWGCGGGRGSGGRIAGHKILECNIRLSFPSSRMTHIKMKINTLGSCVRAPAQDEAICSLTEIPSVWREGGLLPEGTASVHIFQLPHIPSSTAHFSHIGPLEYTEHWI